jgi:hypothetical protein
MTVSFNKNNLLANVDHYSEYVPIISYITLFVNAIQDKFIIPKMEYDQLFENEYFAQVAEKSTNRKLILLVPIFGNIIVAVMDIRSKLNNEGNAQQQETQQDDAPVLSKDYLAALEQVDHETATKIVNDLVQKHPKVVPLIPSKFLEGTEHVEEPQTDNVDNVEELVDPDPEDWGLTEADLIEADLSTESSMVQEQMELYDEYFAIRAEEERSAESDYLDPDPEDYPISLE